MLTPISAKTTTWLLSIPTLLADCTTTIRPGGTVWVKIWTATIGTASENPMRLCSCDWAWVYADNQNNICGCVMDSGTWHVEVAKEGRYSLTLRRWPQESELGISASAPVMQGVDGIMNDHANYWSTGGRDKWDQSTAPIGSFDASGYSLYDMAGNAWGFPAAQQ
ncbi:TPA: hypothetical protein EYO57_29170 [Candidatus Poribacteria bacterium]|nr:hypothetical protein [Candidatus Poribacteria bacterium]